MKDIVAELRDWERRFKDDHENGDSRSLPTEANALRQLVYGVIEDFLEDALGDPVFHQAALDHNDIPLANYVVRWVDRVYGEDDKSTEYLPRRIPVA